MEITFRAVHPWAILPAKHKVNLKPRQEEARLLEEHFLWMRASRSPEFCWPWRMAQEIGWIIRSPVTVAMDALGDLETVAPPNPETAAHLTKLAGATENWAFRNAEGEINRMHFSRRAGWTALYDFRVAEGRYERMFSLNGQGSLEWTLGWAAEIPPTYSVLLLPSEPIANLEVLLGVLTAESLAKRVGRTNGLSLGIRPLGPVTIQRGQPVARLILLHADSLRARAINEGEGAGAPPGEGPPSA